MKQICLIALIAICCFLTPANLAAQESDWGGSYNLEFSKKVTPKLSLSLDGEYRTRNDFRSTDRFETSFQASYKLVDFLKVGATYSLINQNSEKNKYRSWEIRHRWNAFMTASYEINRFKISLREKYQQTYRVGVPSVETDSSYNVTSEDWEYRTQIKRSNPKKVLRSRLAVSYDIRKSKFEPYASVELSHLLDSPTGDGGLVRVRYVIGTDYKINKKNILNVFYRFDDEKGVGDDSETNYNYIGVGFTHKF